MRRCRVCGKGFPLDDYHKATKGKVGHRNECKECRSGKSAEYYKNNKPKVSRKQRDYYWNNREKILARRKKQYWDKKDREEDEHSNNFTECDDLPDLW